MNDGVSEDPLAESFHFDPLMSEVTKSQEISKDLFEDDDLLGGFAVPTQNPKKVIRQKNPEKKRQAFLAVKVAVALAAGLVVLIGVRPLLYQSDPTGPIDWEDYVRSVVLIYAPDCGHSGSGTLVLDGAFVLTNAHVALDENGEWCELEVYAANSSSEDPEWVAFGEIIESALDEKIDLAVIRLIDGSGRPTQLTGLNSIDVNENEVVLGSELKVIGYPGMGGNKITITPGEHAGWQTFDEEQWSGDFYKTSAKMGPGVSGGAAFEAVTGIFIGIPTGGSEGNEEGGDIIGLIRPSWYALELLEQAAAAER